ncbi:diaminopimelate decarboxylase [Helicobacter burdigaliensis]|uniref:diaminopimelate decarboxylase n=1 Tax=Helicobacter burdigaliensis TaxID=2315334 RepID=UPI000EF6E659|nr:diaminopimelate decarboxylase [Helicobacter burdigaliensis]
MERIILSNEPTLSGNFTKENLNKVAKNYGTPLYVYDFDKIEEYYKQLKAAFLGRKALICYALKANSNLSLVQKLATLESGADCVSIGEVKRALIAGIPKYKIIFSGVGKKDSEIKEALELDILFLNLESKEELFRVEKIAKELGKSARISVRVNPNIDPQTHPYISTGLQENKFGVSIEVAKEMYVYAKNSPYLEPIAIHFHIGSQLTQLEPIRESAKKIASLAHSLIALKIDLKFFDIGGGLGITYKDEKIIQPYDYAQSILEALKGLDLTIICEPGRFLVGNCGVFLSSVLYEKKTDKKRFVIIDGAMNDLIRPSLYNAYHKIVALKEGEQTKADVVGPVCESGDFLGKDISLPSLEHNDILCVMSAGAYCASMSSNYNTRLKCAEVAFEKGRERLIKRRESFEEIVQNEKELMQK